MSSPRYYLGPKLTTATLTSEAKFPGSTQVPFLFKVLSIAKALPLQAHPDKRLGELLNKEDPKQFVDANHKPEIAVAIKDGFRGFVGFRETNVVGFFLNNVAELREAIGDDKMISEFLQSPQKTNLKAIFTKLLTADSDTISRCVNRLVSRVERSGPEVIGRDSVVADVLQVLHKQYPGDVGVLAAPFFMNLVTLNKGESVYIGADEAHAYLEGGLSLFFSYADVVLNLIPDIIECMAVSDNVLNAAFVPPESRNIATFVDSLTYTSRDPSHWALPRKPYKNSTTGKTTCFDPPIEEFTVLWTQLGQAGGPELQSKFNFTSSTETGSGGVYKTGDDKIGREVLLPAAGPTIGIVTAGSVEFVAQGEDYETVQVCEGGIIYVKPEIAISAQAVEGDGEVWWATCVE